MKLRTLSPSRVWSPAPADLIAALRALKALPHGTLLVADDGRVLGWSSAPLKATARAPRTVDPVTGEPTGRTTPISQDLAPAPLLRPTKAPPPPRPCAREGCDQQARGDVRARYCSDRCRRLVNWATDNARRRAS